MGKVNRRLYAALDAIGAKLKREKKHLVFELPNGRTFVTAKSPSDNRGERNALSDLQAVVGVQLVERRKAAPDVRAERRSRPGRHGEPPPKVSALGAALIDTGLVERQRRAANDELIEAVEGLTAAIDEQAEMIRQLRDLNAQLEAWWPVRFCRWMHVRFGDR